MLRVLRWKLLSFNTPSRQEEFVIESGKSFLVCVLVGTHIQAREQRAVVKQKVGQSLLLNAG